MKTLGLNKETWTYRFAYAGYTWTLIKRQPGRDGAWWVKFIHHGRKIVRSCGTNIAEVAQTYAIREIIDPALAGELRGKQPVLKPAPERPITTIGRIFETYEQISTGKVESRTVADNRNAMRLIIRRGLGKDMMPDWEVDALPATVLTGQLVGQWEDFQARRALKLGLSADSNRRSVAAYLRHARSLFKATALPRYEELGLRMPDVSGFMTRRVERPAKVVRVPFSDDLVQRTFAAAGKLRETNRAAFMAWLLGVCSLRRSEISRMRWDWAQEHAGRPAIVVPGEQSKSGVSRVIPVDQRVLSELDEYRAMRQRGIDVDEEQYVIPSPRVGQGGPDCRLRGQNVFRAVNAWMRSLGWETNHTLHELRALYLTWIRDTHGLDAAQVVAGHADRRTTQQHYVGMAQTPAAISLPNWS